MKKSPVTIAQYSKWTGKSREEVKKEINHGLLHGGFNKNGQDVVILADYRIEYYKNLHKNA